MKPHLRIIKIGGGIIDQNNGLEDFLDQLVSYPDPMILVHGGGKIANKIGEKMGIPTVMVAGRRVTDPPTRDLVTMVYGGLINKQLVSRLQKRGVNALGLTGADGALISATIRPPLNQVDYGLVGEIEKVNALFLESLIQMKLVPVIAPLTYEMSGQLLNTNADTIARSIAIACSKTYRTRLVYCFDKPGVLRDVDDPKSVIHKMTKTDFLQLRATGAIADGMIPKLDNSFAAINEGVESVQLGHALDLKDLLEDPPTKGTLLL